MTLLPFFIMVMFGGLWSYFMISIFFGELITMGMAFLEVASLGALELSIGGYILHSGLRLRMKSKSSLFHATVALALILLICLPLFLFLIWCDRIGPLAYFFIGLSILSVLSIPILVLKRKTFSRKARSGLFSPESSLLLIGLILWVIAYSSPYRIRVKSGDYMPRLHVWSILHAWGQGPYQSKPYLDLYREAGIKIAIVYDKSTCHEGSVPHQLAKSYNAEGVKVIINLALADFIASSNTGELLDTWQIFKDYYQAHGEELPSAGLSIDAEPTGEFLNQQNELFSKGHYLGVLKYTFACYDRQRQKKGMSLRQQFVDEVRGAGLDPILVAMTYTIDDQFDEDQDLQALMDLSDIPPNNWAYPAFMIMRFQPGVANDIDLTSHYIWSYSRSMAKLFGNNSCVVLGIANTGPYKNLDEIINDIHIVKSCNIGEVGIFPLDGLIEAGGEEGLRRFIKEVGLSKEVSLKLKPMITLWRHINFLTDRLLGLV